MNGCVALQAMIILLAAMLGQTFHPMMTSIPTGGLIRLMTVGSEQPV